MNINDELIACYIEGVATDEERLAVRNYLSRHPEEYEHILSLMDRDVVDYLGEQTEDKDCIILKNDKAYSDIAYSAAAFAPRQNKLLIPKANHKRGEGLYSRLSRMSDELNEIM